MQTVKDLEKDQILAALKENKGIQSRAARALGLTARQLGYKMKKYGISPVYGVGAGPEPSGPSLETQL